MQPLFAELPASREPAKEAMMMPYEEVGEAMRSSQSGQQFGSSQHEEVLRKLQESPGQMDPDGRITRGPI